LKLGTQHTKDLFATGQTAPSISDFSPLTELVPPVALAQGALAES